MPNFFELMTLVNYGRSTPTPTYYEYFSWPEVPPIIHVWSSTAFRDRSVAYFENLATLSLDSYGMAFMTTSTPMNLQYAKAVRTVKEGDLEALGLR
jgi:hypothetical protein